MNTLNHRNKKEIDDLLDTKIYEKVGGTDINDSNFIIIVYFILSLSVYMISLVPYSMLQHFKDAKIESNALRICFYGLVFMGSYLSAESFLKLLRSWILSVFFSEDFISFLMRKRYIKIRLIFTTVFFTGMIYLVDTYFIVVQDETAFDDNMILIAIILSVSFICFLVSETIVDYFDFISFSLNYRDRVKENKRRLKLILKLNRVLPEKIKNLKIYAKNVFKKLIVISSKNHYSTSISEISNLNDENDFLDEQNEKKGINRIARRIHSTENLDNLNVNEKFKPVPTKQTGLYLSPEDFENLFHSREMFPLFDFDKNNRVTKHEFIKRYVYLFEEREKLKRALQANAINMFKIQILITSLFVPFIIFILLAMSGQLTSITESFTIAGLVVFPFTFAFKSVIEELFESVIFVFFIKPFDIGDIFFTGAGPGSERYEVVSIGILYSDFFLDGRFITLKNTAFNKYRIFNLRKSEFITQIYKLDFDVDSFLDREKELIEKLDDHFSDLPSSSYKLGNYTIERNRINVVLETKRVIPYQEIDTIEERHDTFIIYLKELLNEIGIQRN